MKKMDVIMSIEI